MPKFSPETTLAEVASAAKFRPGDVVTHKSVPPGLASRMVILCAYVAFEGSSVALEPAYFVRFCTPPNETGGVQFPTERYAEFELKSLPDAGFDGIDEQCREIADILKDIHGTKQEST